MMTDLAAIGIELALFGMGTVFSFLTLLVIATKVMSGLVLKFSSVEEASLAGDRIQTSSVPSAQVLAAVTAAVSEFRKNR